MTAFETVTRLFKKIASTPEERETLESLASSPTVKKVLSELDRAETADLAAARREYAELTAQQAKIRAQLEPEVERTREAVKKEEREREPRLNALRAEAHNAEKTLTRAIRTVTERQGEIRKRILAATPVCITDFQQRWSERRDTIQMMSPKIDQKMKGVVLDSYTSIAPWIDSTCEAIRRGMIEASDLVFADIADAELEKRLAAIDERLERVANGKPTGKRHQRSDDGITFIAA
jgi:cell fate (sporulation/competence/biofilm development) regulator YmcA (YheA/YmcA/DUF963 family)